jgi:hypothetical protein
LSWELSMQAVIDRIKRAFAENPNSDGAKAVRQDVTEFASELLERYKTQLAQGTLGSQNRKHC